MKFCIVYPYVTWLSGKPCGGAEKQVGLLATHLARRGNEVTFLATESRAPEREVDGVRIRQAWERSAGIPVIRVLTHKLPRLRRLVSEIDADVYYMRGAQPLARWVIAAAHDSGARALLGLAHDRNLLPESGLTLIPFGYSRLGAPAGRLAWRFLQRPSLMMADRVIVQSGEQAAACAAMGIAHQLVPSIVEEPPARRLNAPASYDVFWAANVHNQARRGKGVEPLLGLVQALPDVRFAVAGALKDASLASLVPQLTRAPNVELFGSLGFEETQDVLASSRLVLNTSPMEGFSNVMLEGWALGKPSVTLAVNPSELLTNGRWPSSYVSGIGYEGALGACALGEPGLLAALVGQALSDVAGLQDVEQRCRRYVAQVHHPNVVCARYEELAG